MKRGESLEGAALGWRRKMDQIQAMTKDLPRNRYCRVKYEALCNNPEEELRVLCSFLGIDFAPVMLARPTDNIHHIGGSPSKFDPSKRAISLDTRYQDAFSAAELAMMRKLVGSSSKSWDY
jgi:hypothetical protein